MQNSWHWCPEWGVNGTLWNGMYRFNITVQQKSQVFIHFRYNKKIENDEKFIKLI